MDTTEKTQLTELIQQAEENCRQLKAMNTSMLFEEYWQRFTNQTQTELQNIEVRIIRQYIQKANTEYLEALEDTLRNQIKVSERESLNAHMEAKRKYQTLIDITTYI